MQEFPTLVEVFSHDCPGTRSGAALSSAGVDLPPETCLPNGSGGPSRGFPSTLVAPTPKQTGFLRNLLSERTGNLAAEALRDQLNQARTAGTLSKQMASQFITDLLAIPKNATPAKSVQTTLEDPAANVPEGRYAVPTADGHLAFYQVDKPKTGKWVGYTFLSLLLGSPGDFDKQRLPRNTQAAIFAKLADDPAAAALLFSRKFTVCAKCLAPLSQVRSRATGFGPVCAGHLGVEYLDRATAMRVLQEEGINLDGLEDLVCPRHGTELDESGCWECNVETDIAQRDLEDR